MKRRDLLRTLALGPVAALLPALPEPAVGLDTCAAPLLLPDLTIAPLYLRQFLRHSHVALYYGKVRIDVSDMRMVEWESSP